MIRSLAGLVELWCDAVRVAPHLRPNHETLDCCLVRPDEVCRPGASPAHLASWERRFGFPLPESLKAWFRLSDGFFGVEGPLIHPLSSLGPMVPFTKIPGLMIQPESWFEIGNPNRETICIDLAYRWPGGDHPLFTSGDDERGSRPQLIAPSFTAWFLQVLNRGGAEYWLEPDFEPLGDPWSEHCRFTPLPPLPASLQPFSNQVCDLIDRGVDDGSVARKLGLSRGEVEVIVRHVQQASGSFAAIGAKLRS